MIRTSSSVQNAKPGARRGGREIEYGNVGVMCGSSRSSVARPAQASEQARKKNSNDASGERNRSSSQICHPKEKGKWHCVLCWCRCQEHASPWVPRARKRRGRSVRPLGRRCSAVKNSCSKVRRRENGWKRARALPAPSTVPSSPWRTLPIARLVRAWWAKRYKYKKRKQLRTRCVQNVHRLNGTDGP